MKRKRGGEEEEGGVERRVDTPLLVHAAATIRKWLWVAMGGDG